MRPMDVSLGHAYYIDHSSYILVADVLGGEFYTICLRYAGYMMLFWRDIRSIVFEGVIFCLFEGQSGLLKIQKHEQHVHRPSLEANIGSSFMDLTK